MKTDKISEPSILKKRKRTDALNEHFEEIFKIFLRG